MGELKEVVLESKLIRHKKIKMMKKLKVDIHFIYSIIWFSHHEHYLLTTDISVLNFLWSCVV